MWLCCHWSMTRRSCVQWMLPESRVYYLMSMSSCWRVRRITCRVSWWWFTWWVCWLLGINSFCYIINGKKNLLTWNTNCYSTQEICVQNFDWIWFQLISTDGSLKCTHHWIMINHCVKKILILICLPDIKHSPLISKHVLLQNHNLNMLYNFNTHMHICNLVLLWS